MMGTPGFRPALLDEGGGARVLADQPLGTGEVDEEEAAQGEEPPGRKGDDGDEATHGREVTIAGRVALFRPRLRGARMTGPAGPEAIPLDS